ncbi:MAG: DUF4157 domain-containing protein [Bacteroidota bacterium]
MKFPSEHTPQIIPAIQKKSGKAANKISPPDLGIQPITQRQPNHTGLPDQLKSGLEHLSGMDMSDIRVHHNSSKPADLQAHAYTQGSEIHIGPGQEKHLPHEAWHVVQQKHGRVQPTMQFNGANINDDTGLEREADLMGETVMQRKYQPPSSLNRTAISVSSAPLQMVWGGKLLGGLGGMIGAGGVLAGIGAGIGSMFPGLGTALGAAVGGGIGAIGGLVAGGMLGHQRDQRVEREARIQQSLHQIQVNRPQLAARAGGIANPLEKAWASDILANDTGVPDPAADLAHFHHPFLNFQPRLRFQPDQGNFQALDSPERRNDPNMHFNDQTREILSAYSPQQLAEIDPDFVRHLVHSGLIPVTNEILPDIDRRHGNPQALQQNQANKVNLLHDTFQEVNHFSYAGFDQHLPSATLDTLGGQIAHANHQAANPQAAGAAVNSLILGANQGNHAGIAFGEAHGAPGTREFLSDQMQDLAQNQQVNTMYLEHIRPEYQDDLDAWLGAGAHVPMSRALNNFITNWDDDHSNTNMNGSLMRLLQSAKQQNVRVRAIDSQAAQAEMAPNRPDFETIRDATMNIFAKQQIEADAHHRGNGKYIVLAGQQHSNTHKSVNATVDQGLQQGVPGFSQILNIPAVTVNPQGMLELDREDRTNRT